jgi:hypothetical protein
MPPVLALELPPLLVLVEVGLPPPAAGPAVTPVVGESLFSSSQANIASGKASTAEATAN